MSEFLHHFARQFVLLDKDNLQRLGELYSDDVLFTDPLHEISGLADLQHCFAQMYASISELQYNIHSLDHVREGEGYLRWHMSYRHPRLARGRPIHVDGCSHLLWFDKVYRHRDYFDAGALLYDHVPLLGHATAWLKRRLG